jgi:PAS domain S-box-containing protein
MLRNSSEMASRVLAKDWSKTPLGPIESWPESLKVAVGICLDSRFPMFVWWGDELINIYNDAYVPVLGDRHPDALGRSAPRIWSDIWDVVGPQAEAVTRRGEATWNERVLLTMERNGQPEETYFTWSYSPIPGEGGNVGGVFCACTDDTAHVLAERERDRLLGQVEEERVRLAEAFAHSPAFIAVMRGPDHVFESVNERYFNLVGRRDLLEKPVREALPEVAQQGILEILDRVYATGERFVGNERRIVLQQPGGGEEEAYLDFVYEPIRGPDGSVARILAHGVDRTEQRRTERRDRFLVELDDAVRPLVDPGEVAATCAAKLGQHLGVNRCAYADVDTDEDTFNLIGDYNRDVPSIIGWYRFRDFGEEVLRLMRQGAPFVASDVDTHQPPLDDLSAYRKTRIQSVICVPLHKAGRLVGAMAVHQTTPRRWTPDEIELTRHVTNRCWESLERLRVERALRESEARFRTMSDGAPVMIWMTGPTGLCEYTNAQWNAFTGEGARAALGKGWLSALHHEDATRSEETFAAAHRERRSYRTEYRLRAASGDYRWCVETGTPRWSASGQFLGMIGSVVDIADRKRSEQALASEKRALELIATGSPMPEVLDAIVRGAEAQSSDGMLCSIMLLDEAGERLVEGVAPSLPDAYNRAVEGILIGPRAGSCGTAAYERRRIDVTDIAVDPRWEDYRALAAEHDLRACCSTPILRADGQVLGTVAFYYRTPREPSVHDIELARSATHLAGIVIEKHHVDQRLRHSLEAEQRARSDAERASRTKDDFLATLSHELRTPLNAILGWTQIVTRKADLVPDLKKAMDVIERNARAQAQIIDDLLDMSAIVSGKVRLEVERLELATVVRAAVEAARPSAAARRIELLSVIDDASDLVVRGDAGRLQQVLWNLVSNAVKFTPPDGRVEVRLQRADAHARISVIDTGEGIRAEFLPNVFDRFRQADASSTRRHGGLGLGLSIVKQLVELHGGTVAVSSEGAGRGSTFTVSLPLRAGVNASASERSVLLASDEPGVSSGGVLRGLRVLVVDDDEDARDLVTRLLSERGAQVVQAANAAQGFELTSAQRFDVIVSDIGMPGEDGLSFMRRVRALESDERGVTPAVAVTAYARPEDRTMAMRAGFQMHLAKPVEPAELLAVVSKLARSGPGARRGTPETGMESRTE